MPEPMTAEEFDTKLRNILDCLPDTMTNQDLQNIIAGVLYAYTPNPEAATLHCIAAVSMLRAHDDQTPSRTH